MVDLKLCNRPDCFCHEADQIVLYFCGLAEFERSLISERTSEGRARARKAGKHLGRPFKLTPFQREQALKMRREGQDNAAIARILGVSRSTVSRIKDA